MKIENTQLKTVIFSFILVLFFQTSIGQSNVSQNVNMTTGCGGVACNFPTQISIPNKGAINLDVAQAYNTQFFINEAELQGGANKKRTEGGFFLFDTWDKVSVVKLTDKKYTLKNVNINLLNNEIVFKVDEKSFYKIPRKYVKYISVNNELFKFKKYKEEDKVFQMLVESEDFSFLKGHKLRITERSDIGILTDRVDRVNKVKQYFIQQGDKINRVKLKKKKIMGFIAQEHKETVEKYAKRNELSFKKEEDAVKILNYYATL